MIQINRYRKSVVLTLLVLEAHVGFFRLLMYLLSKTFLIPKLPTLETDIVQITVAGIAKLPSYTDLFIFVVFWASKNNAHCMSFKEPGLLQTQLDLQK